jgi:very-short-patch-repair endonuclease
VHAALWAASDRQAAVILAMTVQQKLAPVSEIASALDAVRRHRRRRFLRDVLGDIAGGSQSLGELDVLSGLRRRRLPEPSRQEIRRLASGRIYLDIEWEEWRLVVEVDGEQHDEPEQRLADTLRDLDVTAGGETVLRIPLLAWRLNEEAVLDRLTAIFVSRGWRHAA